MSGTFGTTCMCAKLINITAQWRAREYTQESRKQVNSRPTVILPKKCGHVQFYKLQGGTA